MIMEKGKRFSKSGRRIGTVDLGEGSRGTVGLEEGQEVKLIMEKGKRYSRSGRRARGTVGQ